MRDIFMFPCKSTVFDASLSPQTPFDISFRRPQVAKERKRRVSSRLCAHERTRAANAHRHLPAINCASNHPFPNRDVHDRPSRSAPMTANGRTDPLRVIVSAIPVIRLSTIDRPMAARPPDQPDGYVRINPRRGFIAAVDRV